MMSGITTIVISSTAARPPMPLRRATSPSKCVGLTLLGSIDGAESLNVPVDGARCASGSDAPVSSILISLDWALTFVARFVRPFLVDRPVNSSFSAPAVTRTVYVLSAPSPAEGSSAISTSTSPAPSATALIGLDRGVGRGRQRGARHGPRPVGAAVLADAHDPAQACRRSGRTRRRCAPGTRPP